MVAKLLRMLQKVPRILKTEGVRGVIRRVFQKLRVVPTKAEPLVLYEFIMNRKKVPLNKKSYDEHKEDSVKILNWVIPEMGEGSASAPQAARERAIAPARTRAEIFLNIFVFSFQKAVVCLYCSRNRPVDFGL